MIEENGETLFYKDTVRFKCKTFIWMFIYANFTVNRMFVYTESFFIFVELPGSNKGVTMLRSCNFSALGL